MLIGLRKAWAQPTVREEPLAYVVRKSSTPSAVLFHHEGLDVYRVALGFMEWFVSRPGAKELSNRLLRRIDEAGTSIALNIAEGNGRYAELDHHRFLQIAQSSAVKAAVYLDLSVKREIWVEADVVCGKEILRRINAILGGF